MSVLSLLPDLAVHSLAHLLVVGAVIYPAARGGSPMAVGLTRSAVYMPAWVRRRARIASAERARGLWDRGRP